MSVPLPADKAYRFNPPPNWPTPPPGWTPPQGWAPPPSWPPPPYGWQFWVEALPTIDTRQYADPAGPAGPALGQPGAASSPRGMLRWAITGGTVAVGLVIANLTGGILGHVLALIVWAAAAWLCIRPARALTASATRMWARIGVAVSACLALYAGSLAIVGTGTRAPADSGNQSTAARNTPVCYLTLTGAVTVYMAILGANGDDCQIAAEQVQQVTPGGTVSADTARPFPAGIGAVCMGTIHGDPATVVAPDGDGGMCSALGFSAVPLRHLRPPRTPGADARTGCRTGPANGLTSPRGRACRRRWPRRRHRQGAATSPGDHGEELAAPAAPPVPLGKQARTNSPADPFEYQSIP